MLSKAEYLAKNYLNADPVLERKSRKRKRQEKTAPSTGILLAEDDPGWKTNPLDDAEDTPTTVSGRSAEFRKSRKSNWTTVGAPPPSNADQAAADAIIASAAAENNARTAPDDEQPQVVVTEGPPDNTAKMDSGAHAGLQTAAQVQTALEYRKTEERRRFELEGPEASGKGKETIYRDASGRIINVAMKRAEARRKAEEEERKKVEEGEAQRGDVQRAQKEARKRQLEDAKFMSMSRYADDADLNAELKERERWNDPAAGFLTNKKVGKSITGRPIYNGAAAPNRYGIRPGHRWDGVDRGNGFEKEYFAAQNRRQNVKDLTYAWQMDE